MGRIVYSAREVEENRNKKKVMAYVGGLVTIHVSTVSSSKEKIGKIRIPQRFQNKEAG